MRCVCAQVGDNEPMGLYVIQYRYPTDLKFLVEAYRPSHRTHMRRLESEGKLRPVCDRKVLEKCGDQV